MDSTAHPRTEGCRYSFDVFDVSSAVEHVRNLDCHVRNFFYVFDVSSAVEHVRDLDCHVRKCHALRL